MTVFIENAVAVCIFFPIIPIAILGLTIMFIDFVKAKFTQIPTVESQIEIVRHIDI